MRAVFEAALQQLVAETHAALAIFCDEEGESIAFAGPGLDPYDVRVIGAQHAAHVLEVQRAARRAGESERLAITCVADHRVVLIEALPGGYYVLLSLAPDRMWPRARPLLRALADRFAAEL